MSQAMEFDINQFTEGKSYIWGHECRIAGGHQWDIYDDANHKWLPTGVPCNPISGAWNHLVLSVERTSSQSIAVQVHYAEWQDCNHQPHGTADFKLMERHYHQLPTRWQPLRDHL